MPGLEVLALPLELESGMPPGKLAPHSDSRAPTNSAPSAQPVQGPFHSAFLEHIEFLPKNNACSYGVSVRGQNLKIALEGATPKSRCRTRRSEIVKLCWGYGNRRGAGTSGFISYTAQAVVRNSAASHEKVAASSLAHSCTELGSPRSGGKMSPRRTA